MTDFDIKLHPEYTKTLVKGMRLVDKLYGKDSDKLNKKTSARSQAIHDIKKYIGTLLLNVELAQRDKEKIEWILKNK